MMKQMCFCLCRRYEDTAFIDDQISGPAFSGSLSVHALSLCLMKRTISLWNDYVCYVILLALYCPPLFAYMYVCLTPAMTHSCEFLPFFAVWCCRTWFSWDKQIFANIYFSFYTRPVFAVDILDTGPDGCMYQLLALYVKYYPADKYTRKIDLIRLDEYKYNYK